MGLVVACDGRRDEVIPGTESGIIEIGATS
jgi:hypothetical protein